MNRYTYYATRCGVCVAVRYICWAHIRGIDVELKAYRCFAHQVRMAVDGVDAKIHKYTTGSTCQVRSPAFGYFLFYVRNTYVYDWADV